MTEEHSDAVLRLNDVDAYYGELQVLRKASLSVGENEMVALFGPNGHGKSTLLKTIAGIHPPKDGSIRLNGTEISRTVSSKIVEMGLAYIPEARNLFNDMTVLENLRLGAFNKRARGKVDQNLDFVFRLFPRLEERKEQMASTLSGGESRILAVGRGLMSDAKLLLIDEPSIGLAPLIKKIVFSAIARIKKETSVSILVVEQEVDLPLAVAERVYLLKKGRIIMEKEAGDINKAEIERAYF